MSHPKSFGKCVCFDGHFKNKVKGRSRFVKFKYKVRFELNILNFKIN